MLPLFTGHLVHYIREVLPSVFLGFFLSGIIHEFVPQTLVDRYLNKKGIMPILYITLVGAFLPLCCFGTLPVAVGFRKKGVPLGPILAFLVATPATSVTALLVTWRLMGALYTIYLSLSVIMLGVLVGIIGNMLTVPEAVQSSEACPHCEAEKACPHCEAKKSFIDRMRSVMEFGFIQLPKEMGFELIIGIVLAALIASIAPMRMIIENYLAGAAGYVFALLFGLVMYICSTASVPLVQAFMIQGLNVGAGLLQG